MRESIEGEELERSAQDENEHVIHMWEPLEFNIDEDYHYVENGKVFGFFSHMIYYGVAVPILYVLLKLLYDLKIEGKENLSLLKTGAVSVSNHVLVLDCAMVRSCMGR